ncbi:katanin p60 ATPase-containing subunit A-like 2 isoform X2 [Oryzias latipes]|uniref:katanin p60 ATPase-containing subunit A-like 2 isoform X2 n=1 Tax=Oryzias latipes TaxID=8090 RepID=UPI0009D9F04E|nr:katanin p60 ATPase-containing subunit A-like 2 isoform X2 [Oryzias latipes]
MELSYQSIKIAHQTREADELKTKMRKKNLLVLIHHHLLGQGFAAAAMALDQETNGGLRRFEVCDNIDLEMVLMEFESYHYVKFQKYPKLIKRSSETGDRNVKSGGKRISCSALKSLPRIISSSNLQSAKRTTSNENGTSVDPDSLELGMSISPLKSGPAGRGDINRKLTDGKTVTHDASRGAETEQMERLLKPLSGFSGLSGEMKELAAIISGDIYLHNPNVRWEDIIGLEDAKRLVKEAVVYPIKYPQLFTGILSPWKGLLLYGPPGTGKTLLAKAVATECRTTFFNISASSIVSKWRGDSEKLVRVLFELARYHAPSTIFLDELESVMGQRGTSLGGEHEGSRRMKTELLVQMDGLSRSEDLVFVLAASNLPWELDHAMLRSSTGGMELRTSLDYKMLAEQMEGYSGSDIRLVCKEAAMTLVRTVFDSLESHQECSDITAIQLGALTTADFVEVIAHTKPSARSLMDRYTAFEREYESV